MRGVSYWYPTCGTRMPPCTSGKLGSRRRNCAALCAFSCSIFMPALPGRSQEGCGGLGGGRGGRGWWRELAASMPAWAHALAYTPTHSPWPLLGGPVLFGLLKDQGKLGSSSARQPVPLQLTRDSSLRTQAQTGAPHCTHSSSFSCHHVQARSPAYGRMTRPTVRSWRTTSIAVSMGIAKLTPSAATACQQRGAERCSAAGLAWREGLGANGLMQRPRGCALG